MAYRNNLSTQISMDDSFERLTERQKKVVLKSWAKDFADYVFPSINSDAFRVLYSNNNATRPSVPANYIIGAMIIKELLGLTDDETVDMIQVDVRAQYALHSTSLEEQPISDRTFSRFRERLYNYEMETGIDLLKEEMNHLSDVFCRYLNINKRVKRMDSLMVAMHAKSMGRLEILYTTVEKCIKLLEKEGTVIPDEMMHYLDNDDLNEVIYYAKGEDIEPRLITVIHEAEEIKKLMEEKGFDDTTEYKLLIRVIKEQSENGKPRNKKDIHSDSLQNPNDPDATYRRKAGKDHKGYVGNVVEAIGEEGASQIVDFDYEQNIHSDKAFCEQYLENNTGETMIADGAYGSVDLHNKAEEKNINLVTTSLVGKEPEKEMAGFELNEEGTAVNKCPAGKTPEKSTYTESNGMIRVKMSLHDCESCPLKDKCHAQMQKKSAVVMVSEKMIMRARYLIKLGTEEYRELSRKRNAIEGIMSVLRRRYHIDDIPVFGLKRSKQFFTMKIGAFNVAKLLKHIGEVKELAVAGA